MIELLDIYKSFDEKLVLDGLSLHVEKGETIVVLGRSGCGKSILLKILLGLIQPDHGEVWIEGVNVTFFNERRLIPVRKKVGMLFQGAALFDSLTVGENVGYALHEHTELNDEEIDEKVAEALNFVELDDTEGMMPSELSGGMRKRVALARAMVIQPKIMLYDEPTTGLDPITATTINALIRKTQSQLGVTSVVVTHELESAFRVADRLAVIKDGKIIAIGAMQDVQNCEDEYVKTFLAGPK